jgi:hypothetical protein
MPRGRTRGLPFAKFFGKVRCDGNLSKTSNFGAETVDIAAPGTDIVSTIPGGGYRYLSGTSCAVPFVAAQAVFAYICAENEMPAVEIKEKVIISARSFQLLG